MNKKCKCKDKQPCGVHKCRQKTEGRIGYLGTCKREKYHIGKHNFV